MCRWWLDRIVQVTTMAHAHDFGGVVTVVTGAGRGIGREIATHMAGAGASVLAVDRNAESLLETASLCPGLATFVCDLRDTTAPASVLDHAHRVFEKPLAILVNNAGSGKAGPAHETSDADWDRSLDINLRTLFRMSAAGRC